LANKFHQFSVKINVLSNFCHKSSTFLENRKICSSFFLGGGGGGIPGTDAMIKKNISQKNSAKNVLLKLMLVFEQNVTIASTPVDETSFRRIEPIGITSAGTQWML
jgi:hypothetical protein